MLSKSRIIGLLAILAVVFLVLRPTEEPSDTSHRGDEPESATDRRLQPREPAFLDPGPDYGIAGRPFPGSRRAPIPGSGYDPERPYGQEYPGAYAPPAGNAYPRIATDGFRFRPLSEREKQRMQPPPSASRYAYPEEYPARRGEDERYAGPYDAPWSPYPPAEVRPQPAPRAPYPYFSAPADRAPRPEAYSFRPLEKSPGARGRWQGPYQEPGRRYDLYPMDPWTSPPDPQWGSTPPVQRMYPSNHRYPDRRLTAR